MDSAVYDQLLNRLNRLLARTLKAQPALGATAPVPLWVALSGGLDSVALLHALVALAPRLAAPVQLRAVHVNHQLSPNAAAWEAFCRDLCAKWQLPLEVARVEVKVHGGGLEAAARAARYAVFETCLADGGVIALAHHADDQLETLLLRLTRGTGLRGMAGMPEWRPLGAGYLLRPLLNVPRAQLETLARAAGWVHVTDESNGDQRFDRNFMRHSLVAPLQARFPHAARNWGESMMAAAEAQVLLEELAAQDAVALGVDTAAGDPSFCLNGFLGLSAPRQRNLLRYFSLECAGASLTRQQLADTLAQLAQAATASAFAINLGAGQLQYFAGRIFWVKPRLALTLVLQAVCAQGEGLFLRGAPADYTIKPRVGGERCRPLGRAHSQSLKKLLQERGVAPWRRTALPLVWCGDQLAAVGNYWICDGFVARNNEMAVKIAALNE